MSLTWMKKPRSLALPTIILHLSLHLSNVSAFPNTNKELFALVRATFILLSSAKKPMEERCLPDRTQETMMIDFSCPWNPSTVLKL
jgi:hypothetical protein